LKNSFLRAFLARASIIKYFRDIKGKNLEKIVALNVDGGGSSAMRFGDGENGIYVAPHNDYTGGERKLMQCIVLK